MTIQLASLKKQPLLEDIERIHNCIDPYIHYTPVITSESFNDLVDSSVFFKCENFQKIGAFKMRGAMSGALALKKEERSSGIATHSSGNHAQAVTRAAQLLNIPAYIVMPENAPESKKQATSSYGANITFCKPTLASRETTLQQILTETESIFIHPYNNWNVIGGQATVSKEFLEEIPDLDFILAPVGGGGLISGTALYTYYTSPDCKVIGVEPSVVDDAYRSLKTGKIVHNTTTDTIADGLKTNLGELTFAVIAKHVYDIYTVSEQEIIESMKWIWERVKILIEPSSAVPVALLMRKMKLFAGKRVGIILSGGNVDLLKIPF